MFRFLSLLCAFLSIGLLVGVAYLGSQPPEDCEPAFVVTPAVWNLGTVPVGPQTLTVSITNPASRPRRIIGVNEECRPEGRCIVPTEKGQVIVSPGQSIAHELELSITRPGKFEITIELYLEDNGIRTVSLTARGVAVLPGGAPHAAQTK